MDLHQPEIMLHLQIDKQFNIIADNRKDIEPLLQKNIADINILNASIDKLIHHIKEKCSSSKVPTMHFYDATAGLNYSVFMHSACFAVSASLANVTRAKQPDLNVLIEQLPGALFWKDANSTFE